LTTWLFEGTFSSDMFYNPSISLLFSSYKKEV
jgi:hypothetical protein